MIASLKGSRIKVIIIAGLILLIYAVYGQVREFGFINLDDNLYVTKNFTVQSGLTLQTVRDAFVSIHAANWHPLTMLSHALDWQLFGDKAGGHHWTNVVFHMLNTALLFFLLNRLTGAIWRSAMVAALFAVHPINVESVAWVAERKNVLSTFFWILSMLFYVWYVQKPGWKRYLPVLGCFTLGLMSKPMLVTLPFTLLLLDYWPLNRTLIDTRGAGEASTGPAVQKAGWRFLMVEKIPLFILTGIFACITLYTQSAVGAVMSTVYLPLYHRISNAACAYLLYIRKMFWPQDLSIFYPRFHADIWLFAGACLILLFISAIVLKFYRKRPYLPVGWLWFLGTMVPVIGLVQVGSQSMADRYAYVPFVGLFVMLTWYAADGLRSNKALKMILIVGACSIILALSILTWQRCRLWGDEFALWDDVLKHHKVALAYNLRGLAYAEKGLHEQALTDYHAAIALDDSCSEAFNNRGIVYAMFGKDEEALHDYRRAVQLNPKFNDAYYNRGLVYLVRRDPDKAISDFEAAIQIRPGVADYYNNLSVAYCLKENYEKALAAANRALELNPRMPEAYFNRGFIHQTQRRYVFAVVDYSRALNHKPDYTDARLNRAIILVSYGQYEQAVRDFMFILRREPQHLQALKHLGDALAKMKRYEEAADQYRKVLQIDAADKEVIAALGTIEKMKRSH